MTTMGKLYLLYLKAYRTGCERPDPNESALDQAAALALADADRRLSHYPLTYGMFVAAFEERRPLDADRDANAVGKAGALLGRAMFPGELSKPTPPEPRG
jgi:hypothetical protein